MASNPHDPLALTVVVTTYRPDARLFERFEPLLSVCTNVVFVDNTPGRHRFEASDKRFIVLQDGTNKGLGKALNLGIAAARAGGAEAVLLFDQDSTPSVDTVDRLRSRLRQMTSTGNSRLCLAPIHIDDVSGRTNNSPFQKADATLLIYASCLPTSGMMFLLHPLERDDGFDEDLFLDLVDFEWCWRLGTKGWKFARPADVTMLHRLGTAERRLFGLISTIPAPYRHYFQFRDTVRLCVRRYVPWYARLRLAGILPIKLLLFPILLDRGAERCKWMLLGLLDAARGVRGIGAANARLGRSS